MTGDNGGPRLRVIQGGKGKPKPVPVKQRLHAVMAVALGMIERGELVGLALAGVRDDGETVQIVCTGDANPHLIRAAIVETEDVMREMMACPDEVALAAAELVAAAQEPDAPEPPRCG